MGIAPFLSCPTGVGGKHGENRDGFGVVRGCGQSVQKRTRRCGPSLGHKSSRLAHDVFLLGVSRVGLTL